jgi:hypothetical protein
MLEAVCGCGGSRLLADESDEDGGEGEGQDEQEDPLGHGLGEFEGVADFEGAAERDEIAKNLEDDLHVFDTYGVGFLTVRYRERPAFYPAGLKPANSI